MPHYPRTARALTIDSQLTTIDSDFFGAPLAHAYGLTSPETAMSSFGTYLVGFIILIIGLGIAAYLLNVPPTWILVGVVVLLGIGILMATSRTKPRDPPAV
jgi:heme A synthase